MSKPELPKQVILTCFPYKSKHHMFGILSTSFHKSVIFCSSHMHTQVAAFFFSKPTSMIRPSHSASVWSLRWCGAGIIDCFQTPVTIL
ncbi:hypothetical protein OIU76_017455 [Salix suchowensis]|uniref:Uncharacterized protein n=1 Tax=Salix suchowensis TaxID=1278906 RepID=A0ABQ9C2M5_9ROSI|nr:hypothetical protein OIU76_017455 [Salix suchowensis]KAJ6393164.1 hypothetical protein OIU77_022611 [Salix suchowensis]